MWNARTERGICYIGITLSFVGQISFTNYPLVGDIVTVVGVVMILTKKIIHWRNRTKIT